MKPLRSIARLPVAAWALLLRFLEQGDLVPLMVIVSAAHYIEVLAKHDQFVSALAIGTLVDVGHFRSVIIAVRYNGDRRRERWARWAVAVVMTALSLGYHLTFYGAGNWWLALPMPILIFALAYFRQKDGTKTELPAWLAEFFDGGDAETGQEAQPAATDSQVAHAERTGNGCATDTKAEEVEGNATELPDYARETVAHFRRNPQATYQEAADALGKSRRTVGNHMRKAEEAGVASRDGSGNWTFAHSAEEER
jgi:DNA-binding transcriptional ArsR family regulator